VKERGFRKAQAKVRFLVPALGEHKMNKHERLQQSLDETGFGVMRCFGDSMKPTIESGSKLGFEKRNSYQVGDIVFCKVKGRYISAHWVTAKNKKKGYQISNDRGHVNGWTHNVYGRVIR
jgi:hypothetical protein